MSVSMNTHNTPSDIPPPPPLNHLTASDVSCPATTTVSPRTENTRIQMHKSAECLISRLSANLTNPRKEQWGSLFDPGVSDWKPTCSNTHMHTHTGEAIEFPFAEWNWRKDKRCDIYTRPPGRLWLSSATGASFGCMFGRHLSRRSSGILPRNLLQNDVVFFIYMGYQVHKSWGSAWIHNMTAWVCTWALYLYTIHEFK